MAEAAAAGDRGAQHAPAAGADTADVPLLASFASLVPRDGVAELQAAQRRTFLNLQQSKELLVDFNELSAAHAEAHRQALQRSAASLKAVVEDLHDVFRRVRALRRRLREALPHEVALQAEFKGAAADDE